MILNEKMYEISKNISIDIIISSTLRRAKETASIISNELQLPVIEMGELVKYSEQE